MKPARAVAIVLVSAVIGNSPILLPRLKFVSMLSRPHAVRSALLVQQNV